MHIDHTTLRTAQLEETKDFMISVFDLTVGPRPAAIAAMIEGYWLYHKNAPIVHLVRSPYKEDTSGKPVKPVEAIDHTAFFIEDYEAFTQKLYALRIRFYLTEFPDIGEKRIVLRTPTGIPLETVFRTATTR